MELKADQVEISTISNAMQKHLGNDGGEISTDNYYSDPAREQRLNLLLHLIHYADLLVLTSPEGSGKTTLLAKFIERMGDDWQIHSLQGDALAQETSLSNRLADIFGSAGDGHADRVQHLINHIPRLRRLSKPVILVIDEAEKLTSASMQLLDKMLAAGDNYGKPVHIVLAGGPELDDMLAGQGLATMQERVAHRLDIPPLSETHCGEFIKRYIDRKAPDKQELLNAAALKRIFRRSEGRPGLILEELGELLRSSDKPAKKARNKEPSPPQSVGLLGQGSSTAPVSKFQSRPLIFGAIALGVALAVIGLLRLAGSDVVNTEPSSQQIEAKAGLASQPEQVPDPVQEPEKPLAAQPDRSVVESILNPSTPETETVEVGNKSQIVVETNEPVASEPAVADDQPAAEAILPEEPVEETAPVEVVTPQAAPIEERVVKQEAPVEPKPASEEIAVVDEKPRVETKPAPAEPVAPAALAIKREPWFLQQNPGHFTLQLMAANNEPGVIKFIEENGLTGPAAYFFSVRDGNPWYAVTYGSYPSRAEADAVVLPASLRGIKPWVRSFGGIHSAIRSAP